jgi:hypothetical protein
MDINFCKVCKGISQELVNSNEHEVSLMTITATMTIGSCRFFSLLLLQATWVTLASAINTYLLGITEGFVG